MKTVLYSLDTDAGTFWIQPQPAGRVLLGIGNQHLRTYSSVRDAVEHVSARTTGHAAWDDQPGPPVPLRRWRKGKRPSASKREVPVLDE